MKNEEEKQVTVNGQKLEEMLKTVRLYVGCRYYGHSNNTRVSIEINDKATNPKAMTLEELELMRQVMGAIYNEFAQEMISRGVAPVQKRPLDVRKRKKVKE